MVILVGATGKLTFVDRLRRLGWGRMWTPIRRPNPFDGELWGFDNGAYGAWISGVAWDGNRYQEMIDRHAEWSLPYMAVLPDVVADAQASLRRSIRWLYKMPSGWPLYVAVQDGMVPHDLRGISEHVTGVFLGGTDRLKLDAGYWCTWAHNNGLLFHYARAGTIAKVQHAQRIGADSLDSCFPLWTERRFNTFIAAVTGQLPQMELALTY